MSGVGPFVVNGLSVNITTTEIASSNVIVNRSQSLSPNALLGQYVGYFALANGDNVFNLPNTIIYQLYIKNIDATNKITVKFTPQGGALVTTVQLKPGDLCIPIWAISPDYTTCGITALTLNASAASTECEIFMGS